MTRWRQHAAAARQLHEKLFYRPLLDAVARLPDDVIRLTSQSAAERLEALGYADPAGALRHISALTTGVSRKAAIQRTLLPAMLGWFADAPRPDAGLLAFRQVSEALGRSPWYLRLLRDDTNVAWRMARLLASGRYATDLLLRAPDAVAMLADDELLAPRQRRACAARPTRWCAGTRRRQTGTARPRPCSPCGAGSCSGPPPPTCSGELDCLQVAAALGTVTAVTVAGALRGGQRHGRARGGRPAGQDLRGRDGPVRRARDGLRQRRRRPVRVRAGCRAPASTRPRRAAHAVAEELRRLLGRPGPDPPLRVDADLRPEGRQGPLVRTLGAYRAYYGRWAQPWEVQALLRADPVAGDSALGEAFTALADEVRYPAGGIADASVREIKRIKARMEAERMPRGVDPALHVKLGPGGLSDAEWVAQLLQLRHAGAVPALRTTQTLAALAAAREAGLLAADDAAALSASWLLASQDQERGHAGHRARLRRGADRAARAGRRPRGCSATRRTRPRTWSRTGAGPPAGPGP